MVVRVVGVVVVLVLTASCWVSDARELLITSHSPVKTLISHVSVLQASHSTSEFKVQASNEVNSNEELCILCEEFATEAIKYLAENKTETEVIDILHKTCFRLSLKRECITLVDYYVTLFFLEVSSVQPEYFCRRVNLCEQKLFTSQALPKNSCEMCQYAVAEVLLKLKDPDAELEIIELLMKGCHAVKRHMKKCKRLVFEYGPLMLAAAEQFLETTDVCTIFHACDLPNAGHKKASSMEGKPMFSDS